MAQKNETVQRLRRIRMALTVLVKYLARFHNETIDTASES